MASSYMNIAFTIIGIIIVIYFAYSTIQLFKSFVAGFSNKTDSRIEAAHKLHQLYTVDKTLNDPKSFSILKKHHNDIDIVEYFDIRRKCHTNQCNVMDIYNLID